MKQIFLGAIAAFFTIASSYAQEEAFYKDYNWEEQPNFKVQDTAGKPIVGLKNKVALEFTFENNNFIEYYLQHKAFWLNSDDRIEQYNKIYLPVSRNSEMLLNKARVINGDNTMVLGEEDVLTATNEETSETYKYFALEGIEKGSIIEYFYILKESPSYRGTRILLQDDFDVHNIDFDLYSPKTLVFDFKSYNGLKPVEIDTTLVDEDRLHWSMKETKIEGLEEEVHSAYNAERKFLIYKLDKNLANNTSGISSYDVVTQDIASFFYPKETSRRTEKQIEKFLNKIGVKEKDSETQKIKKIENYLKTNIYISDAYGEKFQDIEYIIEENVADNRGIMKLYVALLSHLDIDHEIVITSDRNQIAFDPDYEASVYLNDFLLYFPNLEQYTSPNENAARLGYPPSELTDTYGLFIKPVTVGKYKTGVSEIKYIDPIPAEKSIDNMLIKVGFEENIRTVNVEVKRKMSGYYASFIQPFAHLVKEDSRKDFIKSMAQQIDENVELNNYSIDNFEAELFGEKPMILNIEFQSDAFVEKAGNKYLFNVGKLIGKQTEMYQEKERKLPLDNDHMRKYDRKLVIQLPENMKVLNPEDIKIDEVFNLEGKEVMAFISDYEIDGNQLTINIIEHYSTNKLKASQFNDYRRVINAAADFNKITLVLEPK